MGRLRLAADANILIAFLQGQDAPDIALLEDCIGSDKLGLPPVAVSELLSYIHLEDSHKNQILAIDTFEILSGYWERAGLTRASLIRKGYKPKLPDTLIAQSCIDHDVPLLTRDGGFKMFEEHCGLKLQNAV